MKKVFSILILVIAVVAFACHKEQSSTNNSQPIPENIMSEGQVPPVNRTLNDSLKTDSTGIEVAMKFRSTEAATIVGIRYFKTSGNIGNHVAQFYSADDSVLLATAAFTNETDSGWQSVNFPTAVTIKPNVTYIAAYYSSLGFYTSTDGMLQSSITNAPFRILSDGEDGPNGVFKYTNRPAFPDTAWIQTYYWIDLIAK
jgi:uncharacterized protein DUF4082